MIVSRNSRCLRKALAILTIGWLLAGCGSTEANFALGTAGVTAIFGGSPNNELEQTYYFGVFDPAEQLPPAFYRVRVRGQASALSGVDFASGWIRADLIDSIGTTVEFDKTIGKFKVDKAGDEMAGLFTGSRRLILFGPESFREAPEDHRLVIVMGSSPENYFQAMDSALGQVSKVLSESRNRSLSSELFKALATLSAEKESLAELEKDVAVEMDIIQGGQ